MKCSPYYCSNTDQKVAGTVETASFFKNLFPVEVTAAIQTTFDSILSAPALLKLLDATDGIEAEFLHPNERIQLGKYKLPKRRSEYLTGRICAKIAAADYLKSSLDPQVAMKQMEIFNNEQGQPFLVLHGQSSVAVPDISISHSKGYAAALAARHRCGIDIQKQEKSLIRVKEKYCTDKELNILNEIRNDGDQLKLLALLWSAKEAIQKSYSFKTGMPTFSEIQLQNSEKKDDNNVLLFFTLVPKYSHEDSELITVAVTTFMNYAIAVHARDGK